MNAHLKTKTTPKSKITALLSLLLLLNFGVSWGQTTIQPGTHTFQCGTTYNYKATTAGTYTFTNETGQAITISNITVNTLKYTTIIGTTYNTVTIGGNTPNNITYSNTRCGRYSGYLDRYDIFPGTGTASVTIANNTSVDFVISNNINNGTTDCTPAGFSFTVTTPPCCPTLSETIDTTDGATSATLNWDEVSATATYSVAVTKDGALYGSGTYNAGTDESLALQDLENGTYTWTLTFIADGCTVTCDTRTFYVIDKLDCIDQDSLVPQNGTVLGSRWVSWDPVPYADKYTIYLAPKSVGIGNVTNPSSAIYTTTTTSTEHLLPMIPQGDYYWTVIPENTALGIKPDKCPINTFTIRYASADDHDISPSTQGKEFFFSLMENGYDDRSTSMDKYTAIIAPKEDAIVTFYYYENKTQDTFHVRSGRTREITLQEALVYHDTPGGQLNRTVRVTSTADISLYIANEAQNSFDASIVLPTTALGADYMIQTFPNSDETTYPRYACFMVIATEDDTEIEISGSNSSHINPGSPSVILDKGESYFVKSTTHASTNNDLSGIKISVKHRNGHPEDECKTIAVFNGNTLTGVPTSMEDNHDHLVEQAYPISNWGTKFAITSTDGYISYNDDADADYIRITAAEATTVTINDGTTTSFNLAAEETRTYQLRRSKGSCYIETVKPVACYLYQRSASQLGNNDNMGDPSMVWIAPIERGIEKITFSTFKATNIRDTNHWVNIVIPADALDIRTSGRDERKTVWLGNTDITQKFQTNGTLNYVKGSNDKYAYARVKINHGTYTVYSNCGAKMVLHVYGLGNVRGYAYNAGSAAVPYKSTFSIGDGEREFDMTALPADYHFCSGQEYIFRVSSNGDMDSVIFDFQNGERKTLKGITSTNNSVNHTITEGGDYKITAYVFSTVYNHDLCQKEIVVDTVEDHTYVFLSSSETVNDSVCYNTPYTYTRTYWVYDSEGDLEETTFTHNFNTGSGYESNQTLHIDNAKSQYGCDIDLTINLKVFGEMTPGAIGTREIKCQEGAGGSLNLSVTELTDSVSASGGPSDAHYEWQKETIDSVSGTDTTWNWTTISGQTEATYIVVEAGRYRRVYKSGFCNQEYFSNEIFVKQAGSFDPGDHIDETIEVCNYQTVERTIGGSIASSSILGNATAGYYVVVPNGDTTETIYLSFRWQKAEGTLPATDAGWTNIDGNGYNYNINSTFTKNTYFRRLIDATGSSCELNLSMGVFGIVVKPDYNVSIKKLSGCHDQNNAKAVFDIKYADSTTGNFNISYAGPEGTTSGTAVANGNKYETGTMYQDRDYTYTVVDATYGCEKTGTINIANPTALGVATISDSDVEKACQGSEIQLPIPAITGGDKPYSVTITSTGLGITEARPIQVEVNTNDASTTAYNVPMDVTPEAKTLGYVIRDVNNCRVASDQTVVTIEKVPVFNLSNTELTSCEAANVDATITATVTNATGSPKYDYEIDYGTGFNANDKLSDTHTFGAPTPGGGLPQNVYNITVTDENTTNKCSATKEHEIKSNFVPTIVLVVPELTMIATNQYSGCPNKDITVSVSAINSTAIGNIADNTYQYSIDGSDYGDDYSFQTETSNKCGSQTISVYVKEVSTGCVFKQDLSIIIEDGIDPTIDASLKNMDVTTYFCPTYTVPEVKDIKNNIKDSIDDNCASDDDLSVSVTPNTGEFNVTDGAQTVTITVEDLCGKTATKSITITPKPWPNFKINGTATDGTDNTCYCHGDNIELTAVVDNGTPNGVDIDETTYPGATYQWYKVTTDGNGAEVATPITNVGRYSGATTKELKISSAISTDDDPTNGDDGVYKLVITDPKECTKEATITICVHQAIEFNLE